MKANALCCITIVLILYSCVNRNEVKMNQQTSGDNVEVINNVVSPFTPIVEEAIEGLIQYIDTLSWTNKSELVYGLAFYKEKNKTLIGTFVQPFYMKDQIIGYTYFNNRMIVYYGDTIIGKDYVDIEKLELYNDTLPGFVDYHDMPPGFYDPYGILYQIIDSDSLLTILKGMQ